MRHNQIIAFCHIWKTGGTTFEYLLRRHFGKRHLNAEVRYPPIHIYKPQDLRIDMRLSPSLCSLAGMRLKPYVDYEEFDDRMVWYTFLRDPLKRYVSQCVHDIEKSGYAKDFDDWLNKCRRENAQTRTIAGEADVEKAKRILKQRFSCVGILEHYNESLVLMRDRLGLDSLDLCYPKQMNVSLSGRIKRKLMDNYDFYKEKMIANNKLDIELYEYAKKVIWPLQVAQYGKDELAKNISCIKFTQKPSLDARLSWWESFLFQNVIYRPMVKLHRKLLTF